jgi:hypothetical protein
LPRHILNHTLLNDGKQKKGIDPVQKKLSRPC